MIARLEQKAQNNAAELTQGGKNEISYIQGRSNAPHESSYETISGLPPVPGFLKETVLRGANKSALVVYRGTRTDLVEEHFADEALGNNP